MKNQKLLIGIVIVVVIILGLVLVQYSSKSSQIRNEENLCRIGVILPLTGDLSYEGARIKDAMELARLQLPEETRSLIELNYEDGKFLVRDSISAYNKLNNRGMDAWVIFGDTPLLGMKELMVRDKKPVLCLIGAQDLIKDTQWLFHFSGSITLPAIKIAKYAKDNGIKNVSTLYLNEQLGIEVKNAFKKEFEDESHKIIISESFDVGQKDMKSAVSKAMSLNPDAIYIFGYASPYVEVLNELKRADYKGVILTDGNLSAIKNNLINGGEGVLYADYDFGEGCTNPETLAFIHEMKNKFDVSASSFSAFAYESIRVLASIIEKEGKQPDSIHKGLLSIKNYHSIFGIISYRENRELDIPLVIKKSTINGAEVIGE